MARMPRRTIPLVLVLLGAALAAAAPARAEGFDEEGQIQLHARLEPADLGPGGSGRLIVTARIENGNGQYVYGAGESAMRWRPLTTPGVHYGLPAAEAGEGGYAWPEVKDALGEVVWTAPHEHRDPNYPELPPSLVWMGDTHFRLEVPVTIDADVAPGTRVGLVLDYSCCEEKTGLCFMRQADQEAAVALGAPTASPGEGGGREPGPGPAGSPPAPVLPPPAESDAARVSLALETDAEGHALAVVTFTPKLGYHLYLPGTLSGVPIVVEPQEGDGIRWGTFSLPSGDELHDPLRVRIPFERGSARRLRIEVSWQGCEDGEGALCEEPQGPVTLEARWGERGTVPMVTPGGTEPAPVPPPHEPRSRGLGAAIPPGEKVLVLPNEVVPFPVVYGDDPAKPRTDDDWTVMEVEGAVSATAEIEGTWQQRWREAWWLVLGSIFLTGLGLAFTPCVLPIIPLTISVIGGAGGKEPVSKGRLTVLLTFYVLGLSLAYGAAGAASGALGAAVDVEAAFRNPVFLWGIAGLFLLLALGMLGIFELQPPAWMERVRGNVQRKTGTVIKAFALGCLAAVIASPCTGPFVVGLLAFAVGTQSPWIGFICFFTLGLGMGAVFYAAGSLNLLARPGPWMVWVRYAFGIILIGVALYYVADPGLLPPVALFIAGFAIAIGAAVLLGRHLVHKERVLKGTANFRAAMLAVLLVLTTGVVAMLTRRAEGAEAVKIESVEHLRQLVQEAVDEGRPVVVDVWATWCKYCKEYDKVIAAHPELREAFAHAVFLKIDESKDSRPDLRRAVGLSEKGQPLMAFFDEQGRIRRGLDVRGWMGAGAADGLQARLDFARGR